MRRVIGRRASVNGNWQRMPESMQQVEALDYNRAVRVNASNQTLLPLKKPYQMKRY